MGSSDSTDHDSYAYTKVLLIYALEQRGRVESQHEIPSLTQYADLYFEPTASQEVKEFIVNTQELFDKEKQRWIDKGIDKGRQALLRIAARYADEETFQQLRAIDDLDELERRVLDLLPPQQT